MCSCFSSGLENLFHLTQRKKYELLVDMEDFEGNKAFARYSSFSIGPESDGYRLTLSGFTDGGAGELVCFWSSVSTGRRFSRTEDRLKDGLTSDLWTAGISCRIYYIFLSHSLLVNKKNIFVFCRFLVLLCSLFICLHRLHETFLGSLWPKISDFTRTFLKIVMHVMMLLSIF